MSVRSITGWRWKSPSPPQFQRNPDNWLRAGLNPHEIVTVRASAYTRFTLMALVRCFLDFADAEFTRDSSESIPRARGLYSTALELLALPEIQHPAAATLPIPSRPTRCCRRCGCTGAEPLQVAQRPQHRRDRAQSAPESPQPVTPRQLPVVSDKARLFRPTPYRYAVLIERAKQVGDDRAAGRGSLPGGPRKAGCRGVQPAQGRSRPPARRSHRRAPGSARYEARVG